MKNLIFLVAGIFCISLITLTSCENDDFNTMVDSDNSTLNNMSDLVEIPAGSVDELESALDQVEKGGTIRFLSGEHTLNSMVTVDKEVCIEGEDGAVIRTAAPLGYDANGAVSVVLNVYKTKDVKIKNLTFRPIEGSGGTPVLFEGSKDGLVEGCDFKDYQFSVLVEDSKDMVIKDNMIVGAPDWQNEPPVEVHGIIIVNGKDARVEGNDISNTFFGLWACDKDGIAIGNNFHQNVIGLILCKVPQSFVTPNGTQLAADFSATEWKAENNTSVNNFNVGILVIDGANNNLVQNNTLSGNAAYDIELTGDTQRFGFLTPFSFENTVFAEPGQTVKDCGVDNTVTGGILIDTTQDPCN